MAINIEKATIICTNCTHLEKSSILIETKGTNNNKPKSRL